MKLEYNDHISHSGVGYGSDSDGGDNSDTGDDSDQDLQKSIKKKKEDFAKKQSIFSDVEDDGEFILLQRYVFFKFC